VSEAGPPLLRAGLPSDAEALARLRFAFRAELQPASESAAGFLARCRPWMSARLGSGPWRSWVLERRGDLVGSVWLQLLEKLPNPVAELEWHGYISSLFVNPEARGRGLGSRLLAAALAECDRHGCDAVLLWPTPRSRTLYLRHGFTVRDDLLERRRG